MIRIKRWRQVCAKAMSIELILSFVLAGIGMVSVADGKTRYTLPPGRSVQWKGHVGVTKEIPCRRTIYRKLSPSGNDDTSAIQEAIDACPPGKVVLLGSGTFTIDRPLTLSSAITLRGSGIGVTILKGRNGFIGAYLVGITSRSPSLGRGVAIAGGLEKGSTSITTSAPHGWDAGDLVLIDQLNNPGGDPPITNRGSDGTCTWCGRGRGARSLGQIARVVAVPSSTRAILEIPLYWKYDPAQSPEGTKLNGVTSRAGIEELTIDNTLSGNAGQKSDGGTILLKSTADCWLLDVEAIGAWETMVRMHGTYRNTVRGCTFHEGVSPAGSSRYGIFMNPYNSGNLVENSQLYRLTTGIVFNGAVSGNVFAYNYLTELHMSTTPAWNMSAIGSHGAHPMMNLIEGNYIEGRMRSDDVWGSSSHNTLFRNRVVTPPGKGSGTWNVDLHSHQHYYNLIGNVLGMVGVEETYELEGKKVSRQKSIYRFGYNSDGDGSPSGNDPQVSGTALRHANWDSVTRARLAKPLAGRTLPASLYLARKPTWWGTLHWPCIGPDVIPKAPPVPGAGNGTPWGNKTASGDPCRWKRRGRQ